MKKKKISILSSDEMKKECIGRSAKATDEYCSIVKECADGTKASCSGVECASFVGSGFLGVYCVDADGNLSGRKCTAPSGTTPPPDPPLATDAKRACSGAVKGQSCSWKDATGVKSGTCAESYDSPNGLICVTGSGAGMATSPEAACSGAYVTEGVPCEWFDQSDIKHTGFCTWDTSRPGVKYICKEF